MSEVDILLAILSFNTLPCRASNAFPDAVVVRLLTISLLANFPPKFSFSELINKHYILYEYIQLLVYVFIKERRGS